ncbi:unnamed protein product [Rotaria sp. Silwood2]|nr:unnamed protein product [Rotaria sp. Silwood2]CAF4204264.1 unnamed protein product [Rotaria sp. Silwood2]CAF4266341.1 unnamed protein product [Rotaria sp. Silwood2]
MGADKLVETLNAFQQAVDMLERFPNHDDLGYYISYMGTVKDKMGHYDEALHLYQRAKEAKRAAGISDDHPDMAKSTRDIAYVYMKQARWDEAFNALQEVKNIQERILLPTHPDFARTLFTIGVVVRSQGHYDQAIEYMDRT